MKLYSLAVLVSVFLTYSAEVLESNFQTCKTLACPMHWLPVCAKREDTYMTFGNKCDLDRINCFTEPKYIFVKRGRCDNMKKKKPEIN